MQKCPFYFEGAAQAFPLSTLRSDSESGGESGPIERLPACFKRLENIQVMLRPGPAPRERHKYSSYFTVKFTRSSDCHFKPLHTHFTLQSQVLQAPNPGHVLLTANQDAPRKESV